MPKLNHPVTIIAFTAIATVLASYLFASTVPKKIMTDFISIFNAITLFFTLAVVSYYTHETFLLRRIAENNLSNSIRPILVMLQARPFKFKNVGTGAAINICPIIFAEDRILIESPDHIPNITPPNDNFSANIGTEIIKNDLLSILPHAKNIIVEITNQRKKCILVLYSDISGNRYYTISHASAPNHQSALQLGRIT